MECFTAVSLQIFNVTFGGPLGIRHQIQVFQEFP